METAEGEGEGEDGGNSCRAGCVGGTINGGQFPDGMSRGMLDDVLVFLSVLAFLFLLRTQRFGTEMRW